MDKLQPYNELRKRYDHIQDRFIDLFREMLAEIEAKDGEIAALKSSIEPACSTAEILAGEIYVKLSDLEMEAGQGAMYAQDERVHKPIWVSACAEIIRKHCH